MSTTLHSRPWRRLAVLGVAAAVSACGAPVAPTPVTIEVASVSAGGDAGVAVMSVAGRPNFGPCRYCPEIDPLRIPPNVPVDFPLALANTGDAGAGTVHVSTFLVGADGRRIPAAEADVAAPGPRETVGLRLRLVVPSGTPAGRYTLEAVVDPDNRIAESDETDNTWLVADVTVADR